MLDYLLVFMFLVMVVSPCLAARLICSSHDRAALLLEQNECES